MPVDNTQQVGNETNGEKIVGIGKKSDTSDYDGTNMIPSEGSLVNFGKSQTTTLIWISNVSLVSCIS